MSDLLFQECATCTAKPGMPTLCVGCQHNRTLIETLTADLSAAQAREAALREALGEVAEFPLEPPEDATSDGKLTFACGQLLAMRSMALTALATPSPIAEALLEVVWAAEKAVNALDDARIGTAGMALQSALAKLKEAGG